MAPISLSQAHLAEIARRGVPVPAYDRARLERRIVHVGVGGFHRAHLAVYADELAAAGGDWGIVGLGLLRQDAAMADALGRQDHLYTLIEKGDGEPTAEVIGSIVGFVHAPAGHDAAGGRAHRLAGDGDPLADGHRGRLRRARAGADGRPAAAPRSTGSPPRSRSAAPAAAGPLTILSCDNLPGNGAAARQATLAAARASTPASPAGCRSTAPSRTRWSTASRR